ncbi:unnamed protein product [Protopolystoma xenopodis]|uniref:Uncharacterized protein n=1 Tax=Protopolystoma xenopodis TaxID=117903 RepID=A0A448X5J3_9PLAT|nr:unnamed protein product [Protopolystoma xenopodis]
MLSPCGLMGPRRAGHAALFQARVLPKLCDQSPPCQAPLSPLYLIKRDLSFTFSELPLQTLFAAIGLFCGEQSRFPAMEGSLCGGSAQFSHRKYRMKIRW